VCGWEAEAPGGLIILRGWSSPQIDNRKLADPVQAPCSHKTCAARNWRRTTGGGVRRHQSPRRARGKSPRVAPGTTRPQGDSSPIIADYSCRCPPGRTGSTRLPALRRSEERAGQPVRGLLLFIRPLAANSAASPRAGGFEPPVNSSSLSYENADRPPSQDWLTPRRSPDPAAAVTPGTCLQSQSAMLWHVAVAVALGPFRIRQKMQAFVRIVRPNFVTHDLRGVMPFCGQQQVPDGPAASVTSPSTFLCAARRAVILRGVGDGVDRLGACLLTRK
jgi:hypothetical protein